MSHLTVQSLRQVMKHLLDSPGFDRVVNKVTQAGNLLAYPIEIHMSI